MNRGWLLQARADWEVQAASPALPVLEECATEAGPNLGRKDLPQEAEGRADRMYPHAKTCILATLRMDRWRKGLLSI